MDVGKRAEERQIELRGAGMALPPRAGPTYHFVHAILRQRRHQSRDVALVLGDGVRLPEPADLTIELRRDVAGEELSDLGRYPCHGGMSLMSRPRWSTMRCTTKSTSWPISLGR